MRLQRTKFDVSGRLCRAHLGKPSCSWQKLGKQDQLLRRVCCREGWQQLPPLTLSHSHLCRVLQCAVPMPAPARASRASPRKAAATPWECIYIIFVHYTVPNSCLHFAFLLVFTYTSHTLFSACVPTPEQNILRILGQEAQNFRGQLYNEHSKIKATFMCPH